MDEVLQMYKELTEAPGVPGYEGPVRNVLRKYLSPHGEILTDNLGSLVARKTGRAGGPRILLAGHLDEVGFLVTQITDKGFIRFQPLGGWWEQVMLAQRVTIRTHKGDIPGVVGSKPPHILPAEERNRVVQKRDMFIDIGAASREEAQAFGVRPGDPIIPVCPFTVMPNPKVLMAKAWDNRAGCAVAVQVLQQLKGIDHPNEVFAGATVQEEVGLRGAATLVNTIKPDISFALDVGIAADVPGMREDEQHGKMGGGPVILLYDASMVPSLKLRDLVVDTAERHHIPIQFDAMAGGGTDAGRFHTHAEGVPSLAIGFATRYIHSHAGLIHRDDMENAARLLVKVIERLDGATVQGIKAGY